MGNKQFAPTMAGGQRFFALDFPSYIMCDEMQLIYCIREIEDILDQSIRNQDSIKLQNKTYPADNIATYKFHGRPFSAQTSSDGIISLHLFLCGLFEDLMRRGWILKACCNLCRQDKRCAFFFEKSEDLTISSYSIVALSLNRSDHLYLQNGDGHLCDLIRNEIVKNWFKGIQVLKQISDRDYKFKCKGNPWNANKTNETLLGSRLMILNTIANFHDKGLIVYGSGHPETTVQAVDTIYFKRCSKFDSLGEPFILGLMKTNKIYLINAPVDIPYVIRRCIDDIWERGVNKEEQVENMHVFKLAGNPWTTRKLNGMKARLLMVRIFQNLRNIGWAIHCTLDLTYTVDDVSCFIMREHHPQSMSYMAIGLHRTDRIRLINAPNDTVDQFRRELSQLWPEGILECDEYMGCPELVFPINLSNCVGVFCIILQRMKNMGWELVSSADMSATYSSTDSGDYPDDLHTLIFERIASLPTYEEAVLGACGGMQQPAPY